MECRYCQAANADDDHRCRRCGRRSLCRHAAARFVIRCAPALQRLLRFCNMRRRYRSRPVCNAKDPASAAHANLTARPNRARRAAHHLSTFALYVPRTAAGGSIRNHRSVRRRGAARSAQAATVGAAPAPAQADSRPASSRVHHQFAPSARSSTAGGWRHLLRCSGCNSGASRHGGRTGCEHYRDGAGCFRHRFPFGGRDIRVERQNSAHVPGRGGRCCDLLPIVVVPGQWRYRRPKVDSSAAGELRRPDAHARATVSTARPRAFLSLMAGGIGLLWGLVDEETLTWHDHISKTFPTPVS